MGKDSQNYYGKHGTPQKYDPTFKGPIYNRGCTDVICCVLLFLAIVGYVAVGIIAWTHGDPRKVIYPTDSRGEFCGQKGTKNADKPFLFYFNIVKCANPLVLLEFHCPTPQICVKQCPDRYLTLLSARNTRDFDYYKQFCVPGFQNNKGVTEILRDGECPAVITPSKPLAGIMVWVMIVMVILVLGYGIFHCYMEYSRLRGEAGSDVSLVDLGFQTDLRVYLHLRQTWMAFMIILSILEVVIILLLIFLRKRILIAIALIKEASRAVGHVMCSLLYPLVTFFLLCLCIAYWASTSVFLSTSNTTRCQYPGLGLESGGFEGQGLYQRALCPPF